MSKKKPAKKPDHAAEIRQACQSIVNDLYAEVERINGPRLDALTRKFEELKAESDTIVRECGQIIARLLEVEKKVAGRRTFLFPWR